MTNFPFKSKLSNLLNVGYMHVYSYVHVLLRIYKNYKTWCLPAFTVSFVPFPNITFCSPVWITQSYIATQKPAGNYASCKDCSVKVCVCKRLIMQLLTLVIMN